MRVHAPRLLVLQILGFLRFARHMAGSLGVADKKNSCPLRMSAHLGHYDRG